MTEHIIVFCGGAMVCAKKEDNSAFITCKIRKEHFLQKDFKIDSLKWHSLSIERFKRFVEYHPHVEVESFQDSSKIVLDFPEYFI